MPNPQQTPQYRHCTTAECPEDYKNRTCRFGVRVLGGKPDDIRSVEEGAVCFLKRYAQSSPLVAAASAASEKSAKTALRENKKRHLQGVPEEALVAHLGYMENPYQILADSEQLQPANT